MEKKIISQYHFQPLYFLRNMRGIGTLPVIILIGGIVLMIAIAISLIAFIGANSNLSIRAAKSATLTAESGARDALWRISTDKDYTNTSGYTFVFDAGFGTSTAQVTVTDISSQKIIAATSSVLGRTRTIQITVNVHSTTGKINVVSYIEQ